MARIYFIEYKNKRILIEDFTNSHPGREYEKMLQKAQNMISSEPKKSVLALFDATDCSFNADSMEKTKVFTNGNTPYIKKTVIVGASGLLQVVVSTVSEFAGREMVTFKTRQEGLDYLTEDE